MVVTEAVKHYRTLSDCKQNIVYYTIWISRAVSFAAPYIKCISAFSRFIKSAIPFAIHCRNDDAYVSRAFQLFNDCAIQRFTACDNAYMAKIACLVVFYDPLKFFS